MASGDTLCAFAEFLGGIIAASIPGYDPDYGYYLGMPDDSDSEIVLESVMPGNFSGATGVVVELHYLMASANTSNNVVIGAAFQRLADGTNLSGAVSWDENTATTAVPDAAEEADVKTITFTTGADMASVASGDAFRVRVRRIGTNVSDDATGDMRLLAIHVKES